MSDLTKALHVSAAGMKVQGVRLRVISENLANAQSVPEAPGQEPYRRKTVSFKNVLDKKLGVELVDVKNIRHDQGDFTMKFDPIHPAANKDGYVKLPNVNSMIELMDMREAQRTYQANLNVIDVSRDLLKRTVDLLN